MFFQWRKKKTIEDFCIISNIAKKDSHHQICTLCIYQKDNVICYGTLHVHTGGACFYLVMHNQSSCIFSFISIDLKDLIRFITGSTPLPSSRKIEVQFDVTDGCIFASTCLMQIHLPSKFDTYDTLKMALTTVVLRDEKSFNAM